MVMVTGSSPTNLHRSILTVWTLCKDNQSYSTIFVRLITWQFSACMLAVTWHFSLACNYYSCHFLWVHTQPKWHNGMPITWTVVLCDALLGTSVLWGARGTVEAVTCFSCSVWLKGLSIAARRGLHEWTSYYSVYYEMRAARQLCSSAWGVTTVVVRVVVCCAYQLTCWLGISSSSVAVYSVCVASSWLFPNWRVSLSCHAAVSNSIC